MPSFHGFEPTVSLLQNTKKRFWTTIHSSRFFDFLWGSHSRPLAREVHMSLEIENDGALLKSTNYWQTPEAMRGQVLVSLHERTWRLLVPPSRQLELTRLATTRFVRIRLHDQKKASWIILFDDAKSPKSDAYTLELQASQFLPTVRTGLHGIMLIYTIDGLIAAFPAKTEA